MKYEEKNVCGGVRKGGDIELFRHSYRNVTESDKYGKWTKEGFVEIIVDFKKNVDGINSKREDGKIMTITALSVESHVAVSLFKNGDLTTNHLDTASEDPKTPEITVPLFFVDKKGKKKILIVDEEGNKAQKLKQVQGSVEIDGPFTVNGISLKISKEQFFDDWQIEVKDHPQGLKAVRPLPVKKEEVTHKATI